MADSAEMCRKLEQACAGDTEAFGDVVEALQGPLRGFIARLGVAPDEIDDLAQDAFIAAYKGLAGWDPGRPFLPWLKGIARNLVRRHHASTSSRRHMQDCGIIDLLVARDEAVGEEEELLKSLHLRFLDECLHRLPSRSALLIHRRYTENWDAGRIAAEQKKNPTTIRMALSRIRLKLRDCLLRRMSTKGGLA